MHYFAQGKGENESESRSESWRECLSDTFIERVNLTAIPVFKKNVVTQAHMLNK